MKSSLPPSLFPPSDADLARLSYEASLRWAVGPDGRLREKRLQRLTRARGYAEGWAQVHSNETLAEALAGNRQWRDRTMRKKRAMHDAS
jgi:hypothetical protein